MRNLLPLAATVLALLTLVAIARAQAVVETIGFTNRDRQMYGPAVRFIAFDSLSGTHAVWRDGYGSIRYNFRPRGGAWRWPGGHVVNSEPRTLGSMDVNIRQGRAMIAASHLSRDTLVLTRLLDRDKGAGDFVEDQAFTSCRYPLIGANEFGTPKFAALYDDSLVYLSLVSFYPLTIGHVGVFPAFNLAVSKQRVTGSYGYIWTETEGPDRGALHLQETVNNGQNWLAPSRLSDSIPSPLNRSLLSGCGTYDTNRIQLLTDTYDGSDALHSQIWHYSHSPEPRWRLVHDYSCPSGARLGDDALAADRSSIGMNRATGELYAVWEQFDPGNVDPVTGLCRADIWAARTAGAAHNWSPALRLTEPDAASKRFPFLSEVVNDTLHIIYFADQVAGFSELNQGPQTSNAVVYLRVPANLLPSGIEEDSDLPLRAATLEASPNPCLEYTTIRFSPSSFMPRPSSLTVRVRDASGRLIQSSFVTRRSTLRLDLRPMPPGVYFVTAGTGREAASCRIVKASRMD